MLFKFFGADQAQHQFLDVNAVSEALHFASPATKRVRWIVGAYAISTDRFISTGNVFDLGTGVVPEVRRDPLPLFNPQFTYLADSQDNFAWAVFGNVDVDLTDKLELSTALRYDRDDRKNTTETPAEFIPAPLVGIAFPGQVRTHTWDDLQPKVTLRHKPTRDSTLYVGYSRGFRSGGFNQTGVGAAGIAGVNDLFDAETADTYEAGAKADFLDRRVGANLSIYHTQAKGSYFFVFDPNTSTQNLGNLDRVDYTGAEFEVRGRILEGFDGYVGLGYTDSDIKESRRAASDVGKQAPLVSRVHGQRGFAVPPFPAQRVERVRALGCPGHRSDVVLSRQLHGARSGHVAERAARHGRQVLVGDRLGQESHGQEIQRGVVARTDVLPESGLHQQFRFQGNAATLGRRSELSILSRFAR